MKKATPQDTTFVRKLDRLLAQLYHPTTPSVYQQVQQFYQQGQTQHLQYLHLEQAWQQHGNDIDKATSTKARQAYLAAQLQDERLRQSRWTMLLDVAEQLLQLSEGQQTTDTLNFSARMLGCLQITASSDKRQQLLMQFAYKPLYRAVLTLRLLDHLLQQQQLPDPAIVEAYQQRQINNAAHCPYRQHIQLPLVIAIFLQDMGQLHPVAMQLLTGHYQQYDLNHPLTPVERQQFLAQCQTASLDMLKQGLGLLPVKSNKREEREQALEQQQQRLQWLELLLHQKMPALISVLKVPQVYSSVVLPGRKRFNYQSLPKAALLMRDGAKRGEYSGLMVDQLLRITGLFPQGYGVVFTPLTSEGKALQRYEFAIVNGLYPSRPEQPRCRVVSRQQQYRNTGQDISLDVPNNLYFKPARLHLEVLPEQRLKELLTLLYTDSEERYLRKLLPRCWQPRQFFSDPAHQNLWQNALLKQN